MIRSTRPAFPRAAILAVALVIAACGRPDGQGGGAPQAWTVSPEPLLAIGQVEGDTRYLFERVAGARLFADGRVAVADAGFGTVRIYEPGGSFEREIGGPGEGPGEFQGISAVSLAADTVLVYDSSLYRLTRYSADGTLLSTLNIRGEGGAPEQFLGTFGNGDVGFAAIARIPRDMTAPSPDVMLLSRFGADGLFASSLGTTTGMVRYENGPLPFSPFLHAFVLRDSVFFTSGGAITVLDGSGGVARTIAVPDAGVSYAEGRAQVGARLEALAAAGTDLWADLERLDAAPEPPTMPDVAEVLMDDEGRLWLKRYDPDVDSIWLRGALGPIAGGTWSVLDPDDGIVATVTLPDGLVPLDVRGDRIVGTIRDELDVERVAVFALSR